MKKPVQIAGEIEALIQGYVEGMLSEYEAARLRTEIARNPELAETVLAHLATEALIRRATRQEEWAFDSVAHAEYADTPEKIMVVRDFSQAIRSIDARTWLSLAAVLALIATALWWFLPHRAHPVVLADRGAVLEVARNGEILRPSSPFKLLPGDLVMTSGTDASRLSYGEEATRIDLFPGTALKVLPWSRGKKFELQHGELHASAASQPLGKPMILRTSHAEVRVVGTRFTLVENTNQTRLEVNEGLVALKRTSDNSEIEIPAGHYAVAATNRVFAALPFTGGVTREYWTNIEGDKWALFVLSRRFGEPADGMDSLRNLEAPSNWADNYGARIRGYIHPPVTGSYSFFIAANDDASFWLSPDESAENRVQIAHSFKTAPYAWEDDGGQRSAPVTLEAGKNYYFQIIHKAGVGPDHLAVAWRRPGVSEPQVITGDFLSPFQIPISRRSKI